MRPFTFAVVMSQVLALRPWEITHDRWFEVRAGIPIFLKASDSGLWLPCALGLRVSPFPWPACRRCGREVVPLGLPDLTPTQSQLVEMGNQLVSVSGKLCCALYTARGSFSVNNPAWSRL